MSGLRSFMLFKCSSKAVELECLTYIRDTNVAGSRIQSTFGCDAGKGNIQRLLLSLHHRLTSYSNITKHSFYTSLISSPLALA